MSGGSESAVGVKPSFTKTIKGCTIERECPLPAAAKFGYSPRMLLPRNKVLERVFFNEYPFHSQRETSSRTLFEQLELLLVRYSVVD